MLLSGLRGLSERRILFFGGKGGVGKTTCASATALAASRRGKRVLLVSTDPAHSTSDIFETAFGPAEKEILPGLSGLEIDVDLELRRYVDRVKEQIAKVFSQEVLRKSERQIELAASMPGAESVALFDRMTELMIDRKEVYDLIVFDTAPTGHTLRLLQSPDLLVTWVGALTKARRAMLPPVQDEPDPVLTALERRQDRLEEVRARMMSPRTTAFILVTIAERLPIEEAFRSLESLAGSGIEIGQVIVNRVLPPHAAGEFYEARIRQETVYLDEIDRRFAKLPRVRIPQLDSDIHGLATLERVSELLGC
ncbi:MAG: ArsA family ATPase [Vicinamibacteria bacterium]|nr:ArsA family ATPase [Vicinamibacteria bacterium]